MGEGWTGDWSIFVVAGGRKQRSDDRCGRTERLPTAAAQSRNTHTPDTHHEQGSRDPATMGKLKRATFTMAWTAGHFLIGPPRCQGPGAGSSRRTKGPVFSLSAPLCPSRPSLSSLSLLPASPPSPKVPNHPCPSRSQDIFGTVAAVQPSVRLPFPPPVLSGP